MAKVLLVDDDRQMVDLLRSALSRYKCIFATEGIGALHQIAAERPDLVLLDLTMPGLDGALLLPKIRALSSVPVIVLSARHEQRDIVQALDAGADDVIAKPFDLDDLDARVEAVLRRCAREPIIDATEFQVGGLVISDARLATINGKSVHMTATEHRLVLHLARYAGTVVTRTALALETWGTADQYLYAHVIDVHMGRVRRRLDQIDGAPSIKTVRGCGFSIEKGTA